MNFLNDLFANMTSTGSWIAVVVALPFVVIGLIFLFMALRAGGRVRASRNWQTTSGRVLMSYVDRRRSRSGNGGTSTAYYPVVVYEYVVNGQRLQSNRVRFGADWGTGWTGPAQKIVDQYPVGGMIEVFYNPDQPEDAVLMRTASTSNRIFTCVGLFIIGMVIFSVAMTAGGFVLVQQLIQGMGLDRLIGNVSSK